MARKKDENPFTPPPQADVVKASDLVSGNIPSAKTNDAPPPADGGGNSDGVKLVEGSEKPAGENPPPNNPPENSQPVATPPSAPEIPAATVVTPAQLVSEEIPPAAPSLPPIPGQPTLKKGRGRPSIPHPECKKCGRKHPVGNCPTVDGESKIVIPTNAPENSQGEIPHDNPLPDEKPAVNHRQLAEMTFDLTTNSLAAFIGPEWRAEEKEREGMLVPLEMYLKSKQMDDIPPGAVLCFAVATYVAPRLRAPATRSKIQLAWAWLKFKLSGKKAFVPKVVNNSGNPFAEKN